MVAASGSFAAISALLGSPVQFGYAILIGLLAAPMGTGVRRLALIVRPHVDRHRMALTPLVGLAVGILAVAYAATTGNPTTDVLFSGQSALGPLLANSAGSHWAPCCCSCCARGWPTRCR